MWLIHQFDSFLNLGICKEYPTMAKAKTPRTNGSSRKQVATMPEVRLAAEVKKSSSPIPIDLEGEIRRRAYELYEQRGCTPGRDHEDWLVAEREVMARYNRQQTA
jgi:hypothetical protein